MRERLERETLSWREAVEICEAVADGLAAAHAKGVIHRDVKPANIFLSRDGVVRILDLGLARLKAEPAAGAEPEAATPSLITAPGKVLGTVAYMSPEQVRGRRADARSDIFSLGCVLYEMLAGARPFLRDSAAETMGAILGEEPPELPDGGRPVALRRIVAHCLEKDADERFQSARDLAFALRGVAAEAGG